MFTVAFFSVFVLLTSFLNSKRHDSWLEDVRHSIDFARNMAISHSYANSRIKIYFRCYRYSKPWKIIGIGYAWFLTLAALNLSD